MLKYFLTQSQNFLSVLPDTKDSRNTSAEEKTIAQTQFFKIDPTIPVRDVAPSRVSNSHWLVSYLAFYLIF